MDPERRKIVEDYIHEIYKLKFIRDKILKNLNISDVSLVPTTPTDKRLIYIGYNISTLPPLDETLEELYCDYSSITSLTSLPAGLKKLSLKGTLITCLPNLPDGLEILDCSNSLLECFPTEFPSKLKELNYNNTPVSKLYYAVIINNKVIITNR